jgi:hypothetical protein
LDAINLAPNALYDEEGNLNGKFNMEPTQFDKTLKCVANTSFLNAGSSFPINCYPFSIYRTMAGFQVLCCRIKKTAPSTLYDPAFGLVVSFIFWLEWIPAVLELRTTVNWSRYGKHKLNVLSGVTFSAKKFWHIRYKLLVF